MMHEWGIPFDHIETHWTDRQFLMFAKRLEERLRQQSGSGQKKSKPTMNEFIDSLRKGKHGKGH